MCCRWWNNSDNIIVRKNRQTCAKNRVEMYIRTRSNCTVDRSETPSVIECVRVSMWEWSKWAFIAFVRCVLDRVTWPPRLLTGKIWGHIPGTESFLAHLITWLNYLIRTRQVIISYDLCFMSIDCSISTTVVSKNQFMK